MKKLAILGKIDSETNFYKQVDTQALKLRKMLIQVEEIWPQM